MTIKNSSYAQEIFNAYETLAAKTDSSVVSCKELVEITSLSVSPLKSLDSLEVPSNIDSDEEEKFIWTHTATLELIEEYRKLKKTFDEHATLRKRCFWKEMASAFKKLGYSVSADVLNKKWSNLIGTYKKIKERTTKTGRRKTHWEYFNVLDELLNEVSTPPAYLQASLCLPSCLSPTSFPNSTSQPTSFQSDIPASQLNGPTKKRFRRGDRQPPEWFIEFNKEWINHSRRSIVVQESHHKEWMEKTSLLTQSIQELCKVIKENNVSDFISQDTNGVAKEKSYVCDIIPAYRISEFKTHFRMSAATVEKLLQGIQLPKENRRGQPSIPLYDKVLITLWVLGNPESYQGVASRFGVSKSTAWESCEEVCQLLVQKFGANISWPQGDELYNVVSGFEQIAKFPGVVGAIGVCRIPIKTPKNDRDSRINKKHKYSINLLATCNHEFKFTCIFVGFPGLIHESRVYLGTPLYQQILNSPEEILPHNYHLIADSAFPLSSTLLTPYFDNGHLDINQLLYNKALFSTRKAIQHAFGYLKGKFRRLKFMGVSKMEFLSVAVHAACILHNFCLVEGEDLEENDETFQLCTNEHYDGEEEIAGQEKRDAVCMYLATLQN
ncbi:uncharacterized protein LOC106460265 isoform X2 [Limulus polyphemus]|uniref:Uncharacterized protein LOC106460265 isoform X2 n=1 Tax=Limulus polyphemus TaxID=6850 RepID=A0ABM1SG88_LIMPO|nr:uncharacterized protein LOC106460265 isoform X2 [Limulus polyphemus]